MMMMAVNYDVLLHILHDVYDDRHLHTLAQCARVDKSFNRAASPFLYRRVTLSPAHDHESAQFQLGRSNQKLNNLFESARLPQYVAFVLELVVKAWLSPISAPRNHFSSVLKDAITSWPSLQSITFTPFTAPKELMTTVLPALPSRTLRSLKISCTCLSDEATPLLLQLRNLESLTILSPRRVILQILPGWLQDLSTHLNTLRLEDGCGSVTPGVLRSFVPHMTRIHNFALGLSYSLTNDDIFSFLRDTSHIRTLDLRYYLQLRPAMVYPYLPQLRSLTVRFSDMPSRYEMYHLVRWIRQVSSRSPLQSFRLVNDARFERTFSSVAFDGLLDHLGLKHGETLSTIKLEGVSTGKKAMQVLCRRCSGLEELTVSMRHDVIWDIPEFCNIKSVLITTPHVNRYWRREFDDARVMRDIFRPPSRLRKLGVNKCRWQTVWTGTSNLQTELEVQRTSIPPPRPWEEYEQYEWKNNRMLYDM